jgi:Papain-like cysteine protease AvrRpt2
VPLASFLGPFVNVSPSIPSRNMAGATGSGGQPNPLTFVMQSQQQTEWCWAATAASVADYYATTSGAPSQSQCEIASTCLNFQCCPPLPPGWNGNRFLALEDALGIHLAAGPTDSFLSFSDITNEIDAGRLVCCRIQWDNGHFNALIGYTNDIGQELVICDPEPSYGNSVLPYKVFQSNYHGGKWNAAYLTR